MEKRRNWTFWGALVIGLAWLAVQTRTVSAQTAPSPTPTPVSMPTMTDRLAPPPTAEHPTQADLGAQVYYQVCMTCHGDRGQGLTEEFRNLLGPPDNNCWASGCHNASHPPEGFVLPKTVPAVVGPQFKAIYVNALQLHDFIHSAMPWQAPGTLTEEEYWQLTAYLMRLNGRDPGNTMLSEKNAAQFTWQADPPQAGLNRTPVVLLVAGASLVFGALVAVLLIRRRKRSPG